MSARTSAKRRRNSRTRLSALQIIMLFTAAEIAAQIQGEVLGDRSVILTSFAPADRAQPGDLTFAENADSIVVVAVARGKVGFVAYVSDVEGYSGIPVENLAIVGHVAVPHRVAATFVISGMAVRTHMSKTGVDVELLVFIA